MSGQDASVKSKWDFGTLYNSGDQDKTQILNDAKYSCAAQSIPFYLIKQNKQTNKQKWKSSSLLWLFKISIVLMEQEFQPFKNILRAFVLSVRSDILTAILLYIFGNNFCVI